MWQEVCRAATYQHGFTIPRGHRLVPFPIAPERVISRGISARSQLGPQGGGGRRSRQHHR
jgi:hypothetical protein